MKLLFSSQSPPEVGLLKSLLDESGIACEVRNESSYPNFPGASFQPEIWVLNDQDYARACEVRDAWHQSLSTRDAERLDYGESPRSALRFLAVICTAAGIILAWWGASAKTLTPFLGSLPMFALAAVAYNAARHSPPPKRSKISETS
jgi:hypothetical protein